jgi:hypothetical protein
VLPSFAKASGTPTRDSSLVVKSGQVRVKSSPVGVKFGSGQVGASRVSESQIGASGIVVVVKLAKAKMDGVGVGLGSQKKDHNPTRGGCFVLFWLLFLVDGLTFFSNSIIGVGW